MGCGNLSKNSVTYTNTNIYGQTRDQPYKRKKTTNDIFIEDIDDVNNVRAKRHNSIHSQIIQTTDLMLKTTNNYREIAHIHTKKAKHYFKHAQNLYEKSNLDYFRTFRKALHDFKTAHAFDAHNTDATIGIIKCLIYLCKFEKAREFMEQSIESNNKGLAELADFWKLYGICYRKKAKIWNGPTCLERSPESLEVALECLNKALGLSKNHEKEEIKNEIKITDGLLNFQQTYDRDFYKYLNKLTERKLFYDLSVTRNKSEKELYKILSVDGGGIRAILPQLVLCEIEKRCNRYLAETFQLITGTSAGAITIASYTVPEFVGSVKPAYSVGEVVKIHIESCRDMFVSTGMLAGAVRRFFTQKYSNKAFYQSVKKTCKNFHISDVLTEVIIPAVNCDGPLRSEYFTRYDGRRNLDRDIFLADAVMASAAAPSYFPPYKIKGLGCYLDGGLTTNFPAKKAYEEATGRFKKSKDEVYVLSLGTGELASDLFEINFGVAKSSLFWTKNIPNFIINSQTHNADIYLAAELGQKKYKRFEVFLEHHIPLDENKYMHDLVDIGTEYVETKHDEINKVVEVLLNN